MSKQKKVVRYQRRPKPLDSASSDSGVTRQLFARSKPNKAAPKKFIAAAPDALGA